MYASRFIYVKKPGSRKNQPLVKFWKDRFKKPLTAKYINLQIPNENCPAPVRYLKDAEGKL